MSELQPVFTVKVWLDGDDDPEIALADAQVFLDEALRKMKSWGEIRDYKITVKT